jgi:hypothetical protein
MSANALLKFSQGLVIGGDGEALIGVVGAPVTVFNVDNAGVRSWQVDLAFADEGSSYVVQEAYASSDNSSTPTATFNPDHTGSYRWVLKVWDVLDRVGNPTDVDIRVFSIRELNGMIVPPSQIFPLPLPDPRTGAVGAKPNELNFAGSLDGWAGDGQNDGLLSSLVRIVDTSRVWQFSTHTTTSAPAWLALFDVSKLQPCYLRAVFDVIVDNADGNNYGYFNRTSIFRWNSSQVLTHLATGEVIYGGPLPAPTDGATTMTFPHSIAASVHTGHFIGLQGTPDGSSPSDLDLLWLTTVQLYITQRA